MGANFTLFLTAIFLCAIWWGWEWPFIAKMMPIYVAAIPGLILAFVQIGREATGWENRRENRAKGIEMDDTYKAGRDRKIELRRTIVFFGWFIGGAAGIWLLGIVIALPLLVFLYMLIEGREKLIPTALMTAFTIGIIWGLFEYTLEMRWPPGLLFGY